MSKEVIRPSQFRKVDVAEQVDLDLALNPEQLQELSDLYNDFFAICKPGKVVPGKVVTINSDGILVDIGYKSEGLIPRYEFSVHELKKFKVGDPIEVMLDELESVEGTVELSYEKAKAIKAWDSIIKLFEEEKPVEGVVTHKVKGGLSVDIGIAAFLPGSQVDIQRVTNFDSYVGQTITANIIKVNKKRGNVIISRRKHLSDQRAGARQEILEKLSEGQIIDGLVKNITNYGAFIDIGGVDGLLHITDMTWGRISHPSEMLKIGQTLKVKVLSFDKNNEKISLGTKQLSENPWEALVADIQAGSRIKGKISSITDYGLFVEVQKGVEGLIHISEISWTDRINDLNKFYTTGSEVEAVVISLDKENRRMSLSIKQLEKNPWKAVEEEFKAGQKIKGIVSNITDFGVFVQLKPGIDGLVHVSDLSWTEHIEHPGSLFKKDQAIQAMVLGVDVENKKISLGIKQLDKDPWETIEEQYKVGQIIDGEISKITNFGMFVRLASGIEGLVHISELQSEKKADEKIEDLFKVGEKRQFRVIKASREERKLGLSTKLSGEITQQETRAPKPASVAQPKAAPVNQPQQQTHHQPAEQPSKAKSQFQLELEKHAARDEKDEK
jgi:small subunit ribosomal protein S1